MQNYLRIIAPPHSKVGGALPFTLLVFAGLALLLPMSLFLLFNVRTGEILASISQNLTTDYFGIDNTAIFENLIVRLS